jgi:DNA-binding transcriptional MocR family regulator
VKACWLMTNSQNPLGLYAQRGEKAQLVALLTKHNVTD